MVISYHGGEFVKITQGDTTLAFNPISKDSKLSGAKFGADIVLISTDDKDMNGVEQVTYGDRAPFVIQGPGEYEVEKVFIKGFPSTSHYGGKERPNTIYIVTMDGMNLCFLGALSEKEINTKVFEDIDSIDILFVPIGGEGVLSSSDAHRVAVKIEPRVIVPIHYGAVGEKGALKIFLKEEGAEEVKPIEKLTLKKKDVEGKNGEVVVLAE
ncbi:MAG: MBL fold metallo-hydrolase [Candidatus Pacebacteria bacterium]|nr:MBL fold metallo-hydrolase [Candidatus Paceibacterota bacterium]